MQNLFAHCRFIAAQIGGDRPSMTGSAFGRGLGLALVALVLSSSLWLLPAAAVAGCNTTCLDQAIEAADTACADSFGYSGLQDLCQESFRRSVERLAREQLRCKREVLSLKGLVFANCRMSPESLVPGIEARRCVGQQALVDVLEGCDPEFQ